MSISSVSCFMNGIAKYIQKPFCVLRMQKLNKNNYAHNNLT